MPESVCPSFHASLVSVHIHVLVNKRCCGAHNEVKYTQLDSPPLAAALTGGYAQQPMGDFSGGYMNQDAAGGYAGGYIQDPYTAQPAPGYAQPQTFSDPASTTYSFPDADQQSPQ